MGDGEKQSSPPSRGGSECHSSRFCKAPSLEYNLTPVLFPDKWKVKPDQPDMSKLGLPRSSLRPSSSLGNPTFQLLSQNQVMFLRGLNRAPRAELVFAQFPWLKITVRFARITCFAARCPGMGVDIYKFLKLQEITFLREPPARVTAFSPNLSPYFYRLT